MTTPGGAFIHDYPTSSHSGTVHRSSCIKIDTSRSSPIKFAALQNPPLRESGCAGAVIAVIQNQQLHIKKVRGNMKTIIAISLLCASVIPAAYAEEHGSNYVGVSVSKLTSSSSSTGAAVILGHRYNENLAGEIAYEDSGALNSAPEKTSAISIAAIGFVPLVAELEGYARLGYASARSKDASGITANHRDITYGFGVEYAVNEKYAVDLGWNHLRIGNDVEIPRTNENSYVLTVVRSF
jgi:hypothetical protein